MAEVVWSRRALGDLDEVAGYIAKDSVRAAVSIRQRLRKAGESLAIHHDRGRPSPSGVRELLTVRPYIVRYRVIDRRVVILEVRHAARRPLP